MTKAELDGYQQLLVSLHDRLGGDVSHLADEALHTEGGEVNNNLSNMPIHMADQATKYTVFHWLYNNGQGDKVELLDGKFQLATQFLDQRDSGAGVLSALRTWGGETLPYVNNGALFGVGKDANLLFALVSIAAA